MDANLTLFILVTVITIFLWWKSTYKKENFDLDDILVQSYHNKQRFKSKVVLIIESYNDLESLLTLIRNILNQNIKVDSIILISQNSELEKVKLIHNTCIINEMGGLSFLLKEGSNDTILIYIFPGGFHGFSKPYFLSKLLNNNGSITPSKFHGIVKVETNSVDVGVDKIYGQK